MGIWTTCTLRFCYITCSLITYRRLNYWLSDKHTAVKPTFFHCAEQVLCMGKMRNVTHFLYECLNGRIFLERSACMQEGNSEFSHFPIDRRDVSIYTAFVWLWMFSVVGVHINPFMKFMVLKTCVIFLTIWVTISLARKIDPWSLISNQSIRRRRTFCNDPRSVSDQTFKT